jgi:hypothetical protein
LCAIQKPRHANPNCSPHNDFSSQFQLETVGGINSNWEDGYHVLPAEELVMVTVSGVAMVVQVVVYVHLALVVRHVLDSSEAVET